MRGAISGKKTISLDFGAATNTLAANAEKLREQR